MKHRSPRTKLDGDCVKLLRRAWQDIRSGQNLDIYITGSIALVIAILGILGIANQTVISAAILATLVLVLGSLLIARNQNEEFRTVLSNIKDKASIADRFFTIGDDISEIQNLLRQSHKVYFWGTTLTTHIPILQEDIERGLDSGLEVKFLLIKPLSSALRMAAFRGKNLKEEDLNNDLTRNLARLADIATKSTSGKLEYRVIDYLAPYTMYAFDPHLPSGQIIGRLSTLRVPNAKRPIFKLTRQNDHEWFDFHVEQFEAAWQAACPLNSEPKNQDFT